MTVTVQVDCAFCHIAPTSKRVMAKDQPHAINVHLSVILNTEPPAALLDSAAVVVARDQMLVPMQPLEQIGDAFWGLPNCEIPQMPKLIYRTNDRIPVRDHLVIHVSGRSKRPAVKAASRRVAEVLIAGKIDGHPESQSHSGDGLTPLTRPCINHP